MRLMGRFVSIRLGTGLPPAQAERAITPEGAAATTGAVGVIGSGLVVDAGYHQGSGKEDTTVLEGVAQPARNRDPARMKSRRLDDGSS